MKKIIALTSTFLILFLCIALATGRVADSINHVFKSKSSAGSDASAAMVDEQPQELSETPPPATTLAEPTADELEVRDTERDPRAIINFVIQKRSRQPDDQ